LISSSIFW